MTTLPSTSSIRLPNRNSPGGSALGYIQPGQINPGAPAGPQPMLTANDVWRVIRGNLWLIIAGVLLGSAIGTALYYWQAKTNPRYQAEGLLVLRREYRLDPGGAATAVDVDYNLAIEQRTQSQMLLQPELWDKVITDNTRLRETNWFKSFVTATGQGGSNAGASSAVLARNDLAENFSVTPVPDTKLVRASFVAASPEDARDVLNFVVDSHIKRQQSQSSDRVYSERQTALQWRDYYAKQIDAAQSRINKLQSSLSGVGGAVGWRASMKEMELGNIVNALTRAQMEAGEAQGQYESVMAMTNEGKDPPQVDVAVRMDMGVARLRSMVDELDLQLESLEQQFGKGSRYYADVSLRRDSARAKLKRSEEEARATARRQIVDQLKSQSIAKASEVQALSTQVDSRRDELGELSLKMADYLAAKDEVDSYVLLKRAIDEKINTLDTATRNSSSPVNWQATPVTPQYPSSPKWQVYIPMGMFLGLAITLGYAFIREVTDTRVRSPRDIAKVGSMSLLGMIADESDDPQLSGVPLHLVIGQAPHSMIAEQFRQVRTRLQHAASLDTTRTIVVTSPSPQDGKSVVACNLAAGLALNGRRILLVDANFRRPELHKLFNVENTNGFTNVLESVSNLESAVQKTDIANLELLSTGPRPGNPTELIESQLFSDFIDRALEEYDHVIFDTGPLLVVSESVALAPRVDGVITVVRAKASSRGMLTRVRDTLRQVKAEHLGIVLNGVQSWGGGYYHRTTKTYYAYQNEE